MITAHRNPTPAEIKFGYGAIHYADFDREQFEVFLCNGRKFPDIESAKRHADAVFSRTGNIVSIESKLKKWIVSPFDGLRYYRG